MGIGDEVAGVKAAWWWGSFFVPRSLVSTKDICFALGDRRRECVDLVSFFASVPSPENLVLEGILIYHSPALNVPSLAT